MTTRSPQAHSAGSPKRPIVLTIISSITIVVLLVLSRYATVLPANGDPELSQWLRFLGRFHPLVLHLPIGMLTIVLLLEFSKLFRRDKEGSTSTILFFTAISSVVAVVFGLLLYLSNPGDYPEELITDHLWWGAGFASLVIATFVVKRWVDHNQGRGNPIYLIMLMMGAGVMAVASHDGGSITHGKSYLTDEAPDAVRTAYNAFVSEEEHLPMLADEDSSAQASRETTPANEQIIYTNIIHPIFEQKCVSCHGPEKSKGRLRMDTYEALLAGGKEGELFEPGDAEGSNLLYRVHLPLDDDEHMPPEGKTQLEEHEIELISWWIDSGASPDQKLADAQIPVSINSAMSKIIPGDVLDAEVMTAAEETEAKAGEKKEVDAILDELREEFGVALTIESMQSSNLDFTAVAMRNRFDDGTLTRLAPAIPWLASLDLSSTSVTDEGLGLLTEAGSLRQLRLSETRVSDAGLVHLAELTSLESLNLFGTPVTTEGVKKLASLPSLKRLYLWDTQVDDAGAESLRMLMPGVEIDLGTVLPES
jgi:mono/diheme cytochrome c family protein/uncharacterized membrane protein